MTSYSSEQSVHTMRINSLCPIFYYWNIFDYLHGQRVRIRHGMKQKGFEEINGGGSNGEGGLENRPFLYYIEVHL